MQVVQAMMDLTRDNDLTRMGKGNVAASSVSLEAVAQQVRHNKRKERVARDDTGSAAPMEVDTTPSGTPGGTPSGTPSCCSGAVVCGFCFPATAFCGFLPVVARQYTVCSDAVQWKTQTWMTMATR